MATPSRERTARKLLHQPRQPPIGSNGAKRLMYEKQREDGWNNHFIDPLPRLPPLEKIPQSPLKKPHRQINENFKPKKPHTQRTTPPNVRLKPLTPSEPKPNEKDVLRLKAMTAIEYRENLIKQLHKLLEGVPMASPKQRGSRKLSAISFSQKDEIVSVLQEMTQEIQMAGIRAVEAIVAWMLVAGKSAPTPPVFYWHDANYFIRMYSDLDFLGQALNTRGLGVVMGDKNVKGNPLLIEANQKLGRVWAAQSIITEMVEMSQIDSKNDENNALTLVDQRIEKPQVKKLEMGVDDEEFLDTGNVSNDEDEIFKVQTERPTNLEMPTTEKSSLDHHENEAAPLIDEKYEDPAYEDEMFEGNEKNKDKDDQINLLNDRQTYIPDDIINDEKEIIIADNNTTIADEIESWESSWAKAGIKISTVEAAGSLCSGLTNNVNIFVNEAVDQLEKISQAFTLLPNAEQHELVKLIVGFIDERLSSVTSKLEQHLPNDPEAVDEALEIISEAIDASWTSSRDTNNSFILLQQISGFAIPSMELSRILHLMYPYIIAAPQEQKSSLCRQSIDLLNKIALATTQTYLLDALAKSILLMAIVTPDTREISNLKFVCNRQRILLTSMESIKELQWFALFPSFASPTGEKIVHNQTVEAGEGRGPLKEWFELLSQSWTSSHIPILSKDNFQYEITLSNRSLQAPTSHFTNFSIARFRLNDNEYTIRQIKESSSGITVATIDPPWSGEENTMSSSEVEWLESQTPMFIYIKASESYWLNEQLKPSPEFREKLEFVGWTLAMALLHQTTISIQLHEVLFKGILSKDFQLNLDSIKALDPPLHKSLVALPSLPDFDQVLALEELPSTMTVDEYIDHTISEKQSAVAWQLEAINCGFNSAIPHEFFSCQFTCLQLKELVCGPPTRDDFDIQKVFKVVYHDGFAEAPIMQNAFWSVVGAFTAQEKRLFVKFVTGIDKLPVPQTEFLRLDIPLRVNTEDEKKLVLHRLPQAHTCENTLEMPDYCSGLISLGKSDEEVENELVKILDNKLRYAITNGNGFDLDFVTVIRTQNTTKPLLQHEISSDSIDLPNLDDEPTPLVSPKKSVTSTLQPEDTKDDDYSFDDFE
ncbi:hypothetical protein THRCLA_22742 [Thraustotheca clavata]|uniref:HECT-type E3 ubiquitin transferase n=1 Tax=Thraustotheca clavata TaxID=74557 RepID=A0A1V9YTW8_9STRA|nr:hypothetical protein THRCLA_22742 [Thraustotheca clavata]